MILINVKMPTIVGILTFICIINSCSVELSMNTSFITLEPVFVFFVFFILHLQVV